MRSDQHLQTADQRCDEESCDAPMHPVRDTAVISFTKLIGKVRIGDGIAESSQILAIIAHNVAIMEGDNLALATSQNIAVAIADAWTIIDSAHRFYDLITHLPGLDQGTWRRLLQTRIGDALELRDCVQQPNW